MNEGDRSEHVYAVEFGRVQAFRGASNAAAETGGNYTKNVKILADIGRGEIFGESGFLLEDDRRTASVRTIRDSQLIRISKASFTQ